MKTTDRKIDWYPILRKTAVISAVFVILVAIFFTANFIQLKTNDPLNSPVLEKLYQDLDQNPNDQELREQIQSLDLLARKAYFTRQWQINTGGALLFIGIIVLIFAIKGMQTLKPKAVDQAEPLHESWEERLMGRKWLALSGVVFISITILLAIMTKREMENATFIVKEKPAASAPDNKEIMNNWPAFRGPFGHGCTSNDNIPLQWNGESGENIVWQVPVAKPGFNSPIIWGDRLWFSGANRDGQEVYCYDIQSGELLWTTPVENIPGSPAEPPKVTEDTGYAAPTMTTDGTRVYAIFATGDLICMDFDGNQVWSKNLGVPDNHYGHSSSLMMHKNMLLVQYDHAEEAFVAALDGSNGDIVWKTPRDMGLSWASPVLGQVDDHWEFVVSATPNVVSYNVDTGVELWRFDCLTGEVAPSPAYANGVFYATNDFSILAAIKPGSTPELLWEFDEDLPDVASPFASKDYVILPSSWGVVTCLNAETGELYWSEEFEEGFYSSPVMANEHILLMDMQGVVHVIKPGEEFELVAENPLGESGVTTPAIHANRIYIRGTENLYCIGQ